MKAKYLFISAVLIVLGVGLLAPAPSLAAYPDRPIQLIIPYVAGATGDITARMLAEELEKILGAKIVSLNKPGASAVLGTDIAVRSKKDGYTLLYAGASAMIYAPVSNPEIVHYDPFKDVEPLGFHYFFPQTITVRSDAPWKTFPELIDYAKKNPGKLRVSTIGVGSTPHFILEMIMSITGTQFIHVPFEGGETVMTALLGGHVEVTCDGFAKVKPHADAGKMRVLLITNKMPAFPEIPTITELGYKQSLFATWFALYAPSGIPEEARKVLVPAIEKAVNLTKPKIEKMGSIAEYLPPSEIKKMTEEDYKKALEIAKRMGLRK
ncbi:MAG TPA: tripartite tricarboxylate transporter substrate binding protein [Thermodesulfobacteriota bacterium]|nr:tripartite tricarboxylate transporter substrate binding protein [Thermodesulfobacteriota bacterium]